LTQFTIYTVDSAPEASKSALQQLQQQIGFLPNLAATMAESPAMLTAFTTLRTLYAGTSLSGVERELVALTAAYENVCTYCAAAHSTLAAMYGAPEEEIEDVRAGRIPANNPRLAALSTFARRVIQTRGAVSADEVASVIEAGYSKEQVLDVLVGIAMSNLAAQMHHIGGCPVDDAFAARRWSPPAVVAGT
jgi:uncharacterized peroxidase-related enzyme